jgi:hypothetical protein
MMALRVCSAEMPINSSQWPRPRPKLQSTPLLLWFVPEIGGVPFQQRHHYVTEGGTNSTRSIALLSLSMLPVKPCSRVVSPVNDKIACFISLRLQNISRKARAAIFSSGSVRLLGTTSVN